VTAREVDDEAEKLGISSETEEGRRARRVLRSIVPLIVDRYRARLLKNTHSLTLQQELGRLDGFEKAVDVIVGAKWAHNRIRSAKRAEARWPHLCGQSVDLAEAERRIDEEIATFVGTLADWAKVVRGTLDCDITVGVRNRSRGDEASHWLARVLLIVQMGLPRAVQKVVTPRRFLVSMFRLANGVDRGKDVPYYLSKARARLRERRRHPLGAALIESDLMYLVESPAEDVEA
jgi:hypothetical protein